MPSWHHSWLSGGITSTLTKIRKVTILTPEPGQAQAGAPSQPAQADALAH
jgi:hypothetical protein